LEQPAPDDQAQNWVTLIAKEAFMKDTHATLEVIAPTIEEAVSKGLSELGLDEDAVEVEVLDEGSKGLFGLGSRHARVRLSIKSMIQGEGTEGRPRIAARDQGPESTATVASENVEELEEDYEEPASERPASPARGIVESEDLILEIARDTVDELLNRMRVHADVSARMGEPDDDRSRTPVIVDITGKDLSILIGRQAETLNALQYISALILSKEVGRSVTLVIDVQGYRMRREQQLRQLARRMADQAMKTGRRQVLEPMPANERRIIHIELRDHPEVSTESIGEEPHRKVTIIPKT
jgi:spoIIIJ-associated protein